MAAPSQDKPHMRHAPRGNEELPARPTPPGRAPSAARRTPSRQTRRVLAAILALAAAALLAYVLLGGGGPAGSYMSYRDFTAALEEGQVVTATIGDASVGFTLAGDERAYYTDNPERDGFKEELLLAGVDVESAVGAGETLNLVLDVLFYAFFFGTAGFAAYKLASYSHTMFRVVRRTGVTFADVAGMEEPKRELRRLVGVLKDPAAFAARGIRPVKGVILEGPPGNGKTLFARALAQEAGVSFIATKGADFQSAFMSLGARKIRMLFAKAARHKPCIVFIDEFDSIGERRNYAGTGIDKENNRIITAMLNEMDGFASSDGVLVIAATNSYRSLDPALVRPGRFDVKLAVGNPDAATRRELVALYTEAQGRRLGGGLSPDGLVDLFEGLSCAAIETCLNGAATMADGGAITPDLVREAARKADVRLKE